MAVKIGTNIAALGAARVLADSSETLGRIFERLSSGSRINRAGDDAAGLSISQALSTGARICSQAYRNVNDVISSLNIAQSAAEQLQGITTRQRELAEQAANGSYNSAQRAAMNAEVNALVDEYNRIVSSVRFNGRELLQPGSGDLRVQMGAGAEASLGLSIGGELARNVGDGRFNYAGDFSAHTDRPPDTLQIADLDGDGNNDIAERIAGLGGIEYTNIFFGRGDGTFESTLTLDVNDYTPYSFSVADMNQDGGLDIVRADQDSVDIFLNLGGRNFSAATTVSFSPFSNGVRIADLNGDERLDLLTANGEFALSLGGNSYSAPASSGLTGVLAAADMNGDGLADAVTSNPADPLGILKISYGNGDGTFQPAFSAYSVGTLFAFITGEAADLNADGLVDFVTAGYTGVCAFLGRSDGTLTLAAAASGSTSFDVLDLNGDGLDDVVTNLGVTMLASRGGRFTTLSGFQPDDNNSNTAIGLGDINGDGRPDVVAGDDNAGTTLVFLAGNSCTANSPYYDLATRAGALRTLDLLSEAEDRLHLEVGNIGSYQSRLSSAAALLQVNHENLKAAESRISDADIAAESANSVRAQIKQQAAAAVLAHASAQPRLALKLLQDL